MSKKVEATVETAYNKAQILAAKRYAGRADLLNAILDDTKSYTIADVDAAISKYMKGMVN